LSAGAIKLHGKRVYVTVAQDISRLKSYEQDLARRLRIEKLVSRFASRLVSADCDSLDEIMNGILRDLAGETEADRAYFFEVDNRRGLMGITHEWDRPGVESQLDYLQEIKTDSLPWWMAGLQRDHSIAIEDIEALPPEAQIEKTVLHKHGIRSIVAVAMFHEGRLCGFLGFDSVLQRRFWSEADITLLGVVADIVSAARLRVRMEKKLRGQREELIDKNLRLQEAVIRDSLTGLFNHGHIHDLLQREVELASRYDRPLSIIMVDLDYFKSINDDYGHKAGDMVLIGLANLMLHLFRETDLVGRYGGEEFVVLLPETDEESAMVAAERLRRKIAEVNFPGLDRRVTLSAGVAGYKGQTITHLINEADERLYRAKARGRNRIAG
jgi:diguanylate cyclase (GGDEF)-like protein